MFRTTSPVVAGLDGESCGPPVGVYNGRNDSQSAARCCCDDCGAAELLARSCSSRRLLGNAAVVIGGERLGNWVTATGSVGFRCYRLDCVNMLVCRCSLHGPWSLLSAALDRWSLCILLSTILSCFFYYIDCI